MLNATVPLLLGFLAQGQIKADESIVFFPAAGRRGVEPARWELEIRGRVFEEEEDSTLRGVIVGALQLALGRSWGPAEEEIFAQRVRGFLTDSERGKVVTVRLGGREVKLPASQANGHFTGRVTLTADEVRAAAPPGFEPGRVVTFEAVLPAGDRRSFRGLAHLEEPGGVTVISDIDDTIKISNVRDKPELLANTFLREPKPVPGLDAVYRRWQGEGASFHYVSASPWQLYEPLAKLTGEGAFPPGVFHLKTVRLTDSTILDLLASPEGYKPGEIEPLLAAFPARRFVLVGDTGEKDPEIYGALARKHPEQIRWILIRNVTGEDRQSPRLRAAFSDVPEARWRLFREAKELEDLAVGDGTKRT